MSAYAFFETVDLPLDFDVPFFFLALILFTKEFFRPFLFFLVVPIHLGRIKIIPNILSNDKRVCLSQNLDIRLQQTIKWEKISQ
jgi:hypothetical protein